jgi:hypothetical protein
MAIVNTMIVPLVPQAITLASREISVFPHELFAIDAKADRRCLIRVSGSRPDYLLQALGMTGD